MGRMARSCIQSLLKLVNSGLGMVGVAMIAYSLWMLRVWLRDQVSVQPPIPWFVYTTLGLGVSLCVITCSGHIAAETVNGCCLYINSFIFYHLFGVLTQAVAMFASHTDDRHVVALSLGPCSSDVLPDVIKDIYMVFVFLLFVLEAAVTADVFLNHKWEEDFPQDPSGNLDHLKDFIKDNFDICKWIGLMVVALQGLSMLLAMILNALGPHPERYYESDDEYLPDRVPLLKNYVPPQTYGVSEPAYGVKNDAWNIRINSKASR